MMGIAALGLHNSAIADAKVNPFFSPENTAKRIASLEAQLKEQDSLAVYFIPSAQDNLSNVRTRFDYLRGNIFAHAKEHFKPRKYLFFFIPLKYREDFLETAYSLKYDEVSDRTTLHEYLHHAETRGLIKRRKFKRAYSRMLEDPKYSETTKWLEELVIDRKKNGNISLLDERIAYLGTRVAKDASVVPDYMRKVYSKVLSSCSDDINERLRFKTLLASLLLGKTSRYMCQDVSFEINEDDYFVLTKHDRDCDWRSVEGDISAYVFDEIEHGFSPNSRYRWSSREVKSAVQSDLFGKSIMMRRKDLGKEAYEGLLDLAIHKLQEDKK